MFDTPDLTVSPRRDEHHDAARPSHRHTVAMLFLLFLVTRVIGEWVEISQHQHRGEPSWKTPTGYHGAAERNKIYANYSLTDRTWHRNGPKVTNIGNVRRVQLRGKDKVTFSVGGLPESVRAPNIKTKEDTETAKVSRKPNVDDFGTGIMGNARIQNPSRYSDLVTEKTISENPELFNASNSIIEKNKYLEIVVPDGEHKEGETRDKSLTMNPNIKRVVSSSNIGVSNGQQTGKKSFVLKQYPEENDNIKNNLGGRPRASNATHKTTNNLILGDQSSPAHSLYPSTPPVEQTSENNLKKNVDKKFETENFTKIPKNQQKVKIQSVNYIDPKLAERQDIKSDTKPNTVEVIWKLMKVITDNISRNTRRSFRSKVRYLEGLQNTIVANIAERVELAWPDDVTAEAGGGGARRRRDAAAARGHGHVEFPSSESALMTISFLTFAVFLIKLVLQVIHTYKNKTMMVSPAVVAAVGRTAAATASLALGEQIHP